jgi:HEAT repeat protein
VFTQLQHTRGLKFVATVGLVAAIVIHADGVLLAQPGPPGGRDVAPEAAAVARGWALLAKGDAAGASIAAADLVSKHPRSASVLALAIDAEVAHRGAIPALDVYERWLGGRTLEAGYALRRVAHALLRETARSDPDRARRLEAAEALIADGDTDVSALLPSGVPAGVPDEVLRAAGGNEEAVDALIAQVNEPGPGRRAAVAALGKSRTPRAIPSLTRVLTDPDPVVRAAAADALGAMNAAEAIPALRRLVDDAVFNVRFAAASALAILNDAGGDALLREMLTSEHAGVRVAAARATKSEAGPEWLSTVRALTKENDPEIRRQAAELVAPHDPELARATLEPLLNDPNPAQRQAAADSYVQHVTADFAVLRRYLRGDDSRTRIRAAARVLELAR